MEFQPSKYQQAVFSFGLGDTRNGIISAVAGSGKTKTIEELCRMLPEGTSVKYLVFNKRNADEAQRKMPGNVSASTFHSACMGALINAFGRFRVDSDKLTTHMGALVKEGLLGEKEAGRFMSPVRRLVGIAKNSGLGTPIGAAEDDMDAWADLADHFGIEVDLPKGTDPEIIAANEEQLLQIARGILHRSVEDRRTLDFDDMLYFITYYDLPMRKYDMVLVDEAQDTNAIQRDILRRMMGGRLIAVGDARQAIYGFRGADASAMDLIREQFNCETLPLSINYRCSSTVIAAAKEFCPQLEAHDGAPLGSVEALPSFSLREFEGGDAVLCRTTAPLIQLAMRLIGRHMPVTVLGRDIGAGLVKLVRKLANGHVKTVAEFEAELDRYHASEMKRIEKRKNYEALASALDDRTTALRAFLEPFDGEAPVQDVVDAIERLFSDKPVDGGVTLATVHKAKGLEWPRVFILNRENMPLRRMSGWQLEQEFNIIYVAMTRAKIDLRMVELPTITE